MSRLDNAVENEKALMADTREAEVAPVSKILSFYADPDVTGLYHSPVSLNGFDVCGLTGQRFFRDEPVPLPKEKIIYFIGPMEMDAIADWYPVVTGYVLLPSSAFLFDALLRITQESMGSIALRLRYDRRFEGISGEDMPKLDLPEFDGKSLTHNWNDGNFSHIWFGPYYLGTTIYFENEADAVNAQFIVGENNGSV